jgi:hypothetical protein
MIVLGPLFIAGGNAPKLFEPIDQPLHLIAQSVDGTIKRPCAVFTALAWEGAADPVLPQVLAIRPTAVTLIADQPARTSFGPSGSWPLHRALLQQGHQQRSLMPLSRRQEPREGLAVALGPQMDFGAEATLAAAQGFCFWAPFFAPAACWWARMIVLSTKWSIQSSRPSASACCLRVSKSFCQTPARFQREKRLATVGQGP